MCSKFVTKIIACALLCSFLTAPLASAVEFVTCESNNSRYQYCSIRTENRVSLTRQISRTRCRQGDNWGFDRRGVWVDRGCSAEFKVGDDYYDRDRDRGKNDDKKIVAGAAVAAVAIAAAVAARNERQKEQARQEEEVPAWAVGTFTGYDDFEQTTVEITILPGGSVTGLAGAQQITGWLAGKKLDAGRQQFLVARVGNGFEATSTINAKHRVIFRRTGSGY